MPLPVCHCVTPPAERMLNRYQTGHLSVLVSFSKDGKQIISCANYECGLVVVDVATGEMTACETFDLLQEGRNKPAYSMAPDGSKVCRATAVLASMRQSTCGAGRQLLQALEG